MPIGADPNKASLQGSASGSLFFNFPTFMGCKLSREFLNDDVDVVVTGVPFDLATTIRPGARFGPAAIRQASTHLDWELRRWPWDFSVFDVLGVVDCGGLSTDLALKIIRGLVGYNLIGMDIVEVSPPFDHSEITSLAAATLGLEFLYVLAANRKEK